MGLHDTRLSKPGSLKNLDETLPPLGTVIRADTKQPDLPIGAFAEELIKTFAVEPPAPPKPKAKPGPKPKLNLKRDVDVRPDADGPDTTQLKEYITEALSDRLSQYKTKKMRVSFVMDSGTFSMSVMDVKVATYTVAIITNSDSDNSGFIPALGSSFKLEFPGCSFDCFYPGSCVSIPELGIDVMVLGRQNG